MRAGQLRVVHTGDQPNGSWGEGHRNVLLSMDGTVVLDVVDDVIRMVEVLDRPDVSERLLLAGIGEDPSIPPNKDG